MRRSTALVMAVIGSTLLVVALPMSLLSDTNGDSSSVSKEEASSVVGGSCYAWATRACYRTFGDDYCDG